MTSETRKQIVIIYILLKSLSSKNNQSIKVGQLIECKVKDIILEKSYTKCDEQSSSASFSEKSKMNIFLYQQSEILYSM